MISLIESFKNLGKSWSYIQIYFLIISIVIIRVVAELLFLDYEIQAGMGQMVVRFFLENIYYFLIVFLISSVLISKITKVALLEVMRFGVKLYPVVIIPPLIDALMGYREGYHYATIQNLSGNFFTLSFIQGDATLGISLEILLALIGVFSFVFIHTKSLGKSFLAFFLVDLLLVIISTPDLFFGKGKGDFSFDNFLPSYYFLPFLGILAGIQFFYDKNKLLSMLKNIRLVRSSAFVTAVLLGGSVRHWLTERMNFLDLLLGAGAIFLAWQVSIMINDITDVSVDKISNTKRPIPSGMVTVDEYKTLSCILSVLALSFAMVINFKVFIMTSLALMAAYIYSVPPFRLRKNLLGNIVIGLSLSMSFIVGICASGSGHLWTDDITIVCGLIFIFGAGIPMAKDIKDIEGDRENGIKNLFTLYGKEKGKIFTLIIIFLIINVSTVILSNLLPFFFSLIAGFIYYKWESIKAVYIISLSTVVMTILIIFRQ